MANELTPPPSPPPTPNLEFLRLILGNPFRVEGQWYLNKIVNIDGYTFVRCRFDNCTLITEKGTFAFENCYFSGGYFTFGGEVQKAIRLYNVVNKGLGESLQPVSNQDGTISIL